ncbi:hypothetical protein NYE40_02435 [Paenibacillus sp. FSL W8-1187]|uniref:hypothetical protein n=1 Tax=Paenibacillus sp. FSL W8-1187 TaxID=2975339 RepID=UPI0030D73E9F
MNPVRHAHAKARLGTRRAGRSALGMLLAGLLLSGSATTPAAAAEPAASPAPATSFKERAASCGPSTLKSVLIGGASGVDDQLYGARKEDSARIKKVCGMVQAFAKKGKPVKAFDATPYSFFYGLSLTFSN